MQETIKLTNGSISVRTGAEGPHWDPYHYDEIAVVRKGIEYEIRLGLGVSLEIAGVQIEGQESELYKLFTDLTGNPPFMWQNWLWVCKGRRKFQCRHCRSKDITEHEGFPGETIYLCNGCKTIVDCDFDEGAIL
jgi:hypothetical protein